MQSRVLVVDDDPDIVQFVRVSLELEGFDVLTASNGQEAIDRVVATKPDVVLLDVMMPKMDGLTALKEMRAHPAAANTSVILLTARALSEDRVKGLEMGADDYITKPFDVDELVARVKAVTRRSQAMRDVSPLTGLPGNHRISLELDRRIEEGKPFALAYADLDNFKAFNDHYGFMRGDQVIRFCAHSLLEAAKGLNGEVFVGHVGGDDFVVLMEAAVARRYAERATREFDDGILDFYDTSDALRGYVEVTDRRGDRHAFPVVSLSIGIVTNLSRDFESQFEASAVAVEMKEFAKKTPGSSYEIDRRHS